MRGGVLRSAPLRRAPPLADAACVGANLKTRTWVRTLGAGDPGPSWWPGSGFVFPVTHLLRSSDLRGLSKWQTCLAALLLALPLACGLAPCLHYTHTHTQIRGTANLLKRGSRGSTNEAGFRYLRFCMFGFVWHFHAVRCLLGFGDLRHGVLEFRVFGRIGGSASLV